jgi:hypothetical protein
MGSEAQVVQNTWALRILQGKEGKKQGPRTTGITFSLFYIPFSED